MMMNKKGLLIWVVIAMLMGLNSAIAQTNLEPPRNPNSAKACAICHFRWVDKLMIRLEPAVDDIVFSKKFPEDEEMSDSK